MRGIHSFQSLFFSFLVAIVTTSTAAAQTAGGATPPGTSAPSPFETTAAPTAAAPSPFDAPAAPQPQVVVQPQPAAVYVQPAPAVAVAPAPVPYGRGRVRGIGSLSAGIVLLALSAIPFGIGGGMHDYWEACEWDGDTYYCGNTGAHLASMLLFGFGGAIALGGLVLLPIGAARVAQTSRYARRRGPRLATLTPFAAPAGGGAVFGFSGIL